MAGIKYFVPIEVAGPTGAVAATRYAGGTASGAPASGSFLLGDFVVAQDGRIWVCTAAGSPGTWADAGALANPLPVDLVISGDGSAGTTPANPGVSLGVEVGGNNNAHMEIASPASTGVAYQDFTVVGEDYRVRQYWDEGGAVYGVAVPSLSHTLTIDSDGLKMDGVLVSAGAPKGANYSGSPVTVADGTAENLTFDNLDGGTELLDRTDPANPLILADGVYALSANMTVAALTATGYATIRAAVIGALDVAGVEADANLYPTVAGVAGTPTATTVPVFLPAGALVNVYAENHDGVASRDFALSGQATFLTKLS